MNAEVNIILDGKPLQVAKGQTILQAAQSAGIEIPHYCYHPGLSIAGNCRMCLVAVDKSPKPMIACSAQVVEGMVVHTNTPQVKDMREAILEFILINHPLDCPTCDQAGECKLQDYYMQHDLQPSRFQEEKVHKPKMVPLGAHVMLDEERCIVCTRCVRFCSEIGRQEELYVANRGDHSMITTFPGRPLANAYAGNVVDICPVGALTNQDFRFKKRVWYLDHTDSICPGCARGCNIRLDHEDSVVYRVLPRFHAEINQHWICDEGRYGYKFINEGRILKAHRWEAAKLVPILMREAYPLIAAILAGRSGGEIAVVVSAQESNEVGNIFKDFAYDFLQTKNIFYSAHEVAQPSADDFLIRADKNPNRVGVETLGFKPIAPAGLTGVKVLIVLNALSERDEQMVMTAGVQDTILFASNWSATSDRARVILPLPTWAEQAGTFTNFEGRLQRFHQAFAPRGEAKPLAEHLQRIREATGHCLLSETA